MAGFRSTGGSFRPDPIPAGFELVGDPIPDGWTLDEEPDVGTTSFADDDRRFRGLGGIGEISAAEEGLRSRKGPGASPLEQLTDRIEARHRADRRERGAEADRRQGLSRDHAAYATNFASEFAPPVGEIMTAEDRRLQDVGRDLGADDSTWAETMRKAVQNLDDTIIGRGGGGIIEALPTTLRYLAAATGNTVALSMPKTGIEQSVEEAGQGIFRRASAEIERNAPELSGSPGKQFAYDLVNAFSSLATAVGVTATTKSPAAGMSVLGAQVFGDRFGQSIEEGRTREQAFMDGAVYGLAEMAGENKVLGAIMKPGGTVAGKIGAGAVGESLQEGLTSVIQNGYDVGVLREDMTLGEFARAVTYDMALGGAAGGAAAGVVAPFTRRAPEQVSFDSGMERPDGLFEAASVTPVTLTPEDVASPLPNERIAQGRQRMETAAGVKTANQILQANGVPALNSRVEVIIGGEAKQGVIEDAFSREDGEGIKVKLDDGSTFDEYFDNVRDAGVAIIPLERREEPALAAPSAGEARQQPRVPAGQTRQPTPSFDRMVEITGFAESGNRERDAKGNLITSPAGAQGKMQVMPGTNVDPGFGVRPAQDGSDAERTRVGRDYLAAMMRRYGNDPAKAWAAYNAGPGRLDSAMKRHGADWLANMPAETQAYVRGNVGKLGGQTVEVARAVEAEPIEPETGWIDDILQEAPEPAPTLAAPVQEPDRLREKMGEPRVIDFEDFANENGASRLAFGEAGLHKRGHMSDTAHRRAMRTMIERDEKLATRRAELQNQYDAAVKRGEIRPMTSEERLEQTAQGDENMPSVQAARRVLEKRAARAGDGTRTSPVEARTADDVARAGERVNTEPTEAQAAAGNYSKGHVRLHGLDIAIENPKGSERSGVGDNGRRWTTKLDKAAYGYVKKTEGADGDQVDVYIGDKPESDRAFVIDQYDPKTGKFDETKTVLGVETRDEALAIYDHGFSDGTGPQRRKGVTEMSAAEFGEYLKGDTTGPAATEAVAEPAFDPTAHVEKLRSIVADSKVNLNDPAKLAKAMGLEPDQANVVMGALAARPDAGFYVSRGRPARYRTVQTGGGRKKGTKRVKIADATPSRIRRVPKREGPVPLAAFLRDRGGLSDTEGHDLAKGRGLLRRFPGLVNNRSGRSIDEALEIAAEAGYFTAARQELTTDDLLQAVEENRYRPEDEAEARDRAARRDGRESETRAELKRLAKENGLLLSETDTAAIIDRAESSDPIVSGSLESALYEHFQTAAETWHDNAFAETGDYDIPTRDEAEQRSSEDADERPEEGRDGRPVESGDAPRGKAAGTDSGEAEQQVGRAGVGAAGDVTGIAIATATSPSPDQADAFGERPEDKRVSLERKGEGRKRSDRQQKPPGSDGGLFDTRDTTGDMLARPSASWVIREKGTGNVIMETFDRKKVDALNTKKYEAVPIQEHLAGLNSPRADQPTDALAQAKAALQTAMTALDQATVGSLVDTLTDPRPLTAMYEKGDFLTMSGEVGEVQSANERSVVINFPSGQRIVPRNQAGLEVADPALWPKPEQPKFSRVHSEESPIFYSALERAVEASPTKRASGAQWIATLAKTPGIKRDELEWTGVFDWLDAHEGPVERDVLLQVIRDGGIKVEEVVLGAPSQSAIEEAADRILEDVVEDQMGDGLSEDDARDFANSNYGRYLELAEANLRDETSPQFADWSSDPSNRTYRELLITLPLGEGGNPDRAPATHWDDGIPAAADSKRHGVVAHARFMEKRDAEGKRVLFIEEVQSDWHQKGRDEGYEQTASAEEQAEASDKLENARRRYVDASAAVKELAVDLGIANASEDEGEQSPFYAALLRVNYNHRRSSEAQEASEEYRRAELALREARQRLDNLMRPSGIPDAPFKSSWPALVMKRMIRFGADNGFDKIAWTTGAEQAERYSLEERVQSVRSRPHPIGGGTIDPSRVELYFGKDIASTLADGGAGDYDPNSNTLLVTREQSVALFGKDLGGRIFDEGKAAPWQNPGSGPHFTGLDLQVGGEGMRQFYDRNLVNIANDFLKRYGVKVGRVRLPLGQREMSERAERRFLDGDTETGITRNFAENPGFDLSPKLIEAARGGFPLFRRENGVIAPVDPETAARWRDKLQAEMKRLGIDDRILLEVVGKSEFGDNVAGVYWRRTITVALDSPRDPLQTLGHEAIHALKDLGLFRPSEWTALVKLVADHPAMSDIERRYPDLTRDQQIEEAIADLYGYWRSGRESVKGFVAKAFQRISDLIKAIQAAFRTTPGQVFRDIESGKIGRRESGGAREFGRTRFSSDAFGAWFKDSKVVDANGAPLVVYHGTGANFEAFETTEGTELAGVFFSSDREGAYDWGARRVSKPKVISAYVSLQNPADQQTVDEVAEEYRDENGEDPSPYALTEALQTAGYDGFMDQSSYEDALEIVAFEPSQIKSTANRGSWDPADDRIMFSIPNSPQIDFGRGKFGERLDEWRTAMQDRMLPILRAQAGVEKLIGRELGENEQPYRQEALYTGRVGAQFEEMEEKLIEPLFESMKAEKVTVGELESYLYARHAPERNAKLKKEGVENGSGMSDIEAAAVMKRIAESGKTEALERVAAHVDKMLAFAVQTRIDGGLMTQEQADEWKGQWRHYVPLRGFAEHPDADERPNVGQGYTVRGPESKRAFGRRSKADDIVGHSIMQAEEAIVRAEKNRVAVELYNMAKAAPDKNFWEIAKVTTKKRINKETGLVETYPVTTMTMEDAKWTVSLKIDGKQHRVTFNRRNRSAVRAAQAMRRLNEPEISIRALQIVNQWLSKANTTLNPDFIFRNAFRDLQTAVANISEFDIRGMRRALVASYPKALAAATKGAFKRGGESEWDQAWRDFVADGSRVYYNQVRDIDELRVDIEKRFRAIQDKKLTPKQAGLKVWEGLKWSFGKIEQANLGVENAVRLSAYKNLRDRGVSRKQAAFIAKGLTVDFNRRGTYGVLMNSLYLFWNATVQGNTRMLLALKHRRTQRVAGAMVVAGALNAMLNVLASGADDDDQLIYDKLSEHEKSTNLIFMIPGSDKPIKVAIPYGYNVFFNLGRQMVDTVRGKKSALEAGGDWLFAVANAFNPVGGSESLANFLAPTVFDPAVDLQIDNRDFADRPIMPDQPQFGTPSPDNQRFWPSVSPYFKALTDFANRASGGDEVVPGFVDVSPETLEYLTAYVTGAAGATIMRAGGGINKALDDDPTTALEISDVPVLRTIVGKKPSWYEKAAFHARVDHVEETISRAKDYVGDVKGEVRNPEGLDRFIENNRDVLDVERGLKEAKREMRRVKKERGKLEADFEAGRIDKAAYNDGRVALKEHEDGVIAAFNKHYLDYVNEPVGADD